MQMNMMPVQNQFSASRYYNMSDIQSPPILSSDNILFVADLPDDTCEEDLFNFFKDYNYICCRVVSNMSHTYSFVHFVSRADAEKARNELNGVKLTPKYSKNKIAKPVRLCKYETKTNMTSLDSKCNLLVKNLSKTFSAHKLFLTFKRYGDIRSSRLMIDILGESKGFGFVSFYKKEEAEKAKNEMDDKEIDGKKIKVNFLEKGRKHQIKRNNIYVKHIPKNNFGDEDLKNLFKNFGEITSAKVPKDEKGESKGFGFVCFANPDDADKAMKEMRDKQIFEGIEDKLYVSFAMKKGERKELLLKKRQEMFKMSQKMTIYAKIKDETEIESESAYEEEIKTYLKNLIGEDYHPKYIKIQFEKKNAFITMNSQKEAEEFVKKFHEFSQTNSTKIYFNLYKPKVDRANASSYFKKYNQFSETGSLASGSKHSQKYVSYNNFDNPQGPYVSKSPQMNPQMNPQMRPMRVYQTYNDLGNMPQGQPQPQPMMPREEGIPMREELNNFERRPEKPIDEREALGEQIYGIAAQMFSADVAGKITGMILELEPDRIRYMLNDKNELKKLLLQASDQLEKGNQ
ncbi:MAG: hypothetical protein MJ252_10215 [archaeon]|nr:hypothetical protein [archaeon]